MPLSSSMDDSKIIVYLDSSDYSDLSAPSNGKLKRVRAELLDFSASGKVTFAYSGVHISEMSPLDARSSDNGAARIDFLVELCGKNAFFSFDRLIESEISNLATLSMPKIDILSQDGTWFPEVKNIISPLQWLDVAKSLDSKAKKQGLNRQQRRIMKKKLIKSGKTPSQFLNSFGATAYSDYEEILLLYPMRPQDMEVIRNYVVEKATASDVEAAFLNSLRNPRWMARWFSKHYNKMTPVVNWLRSPAKKVAEKMGMIANQINIDLEKFSDKETKKYIIKKIRSGQKTSQDELLLKLVNQLLEDYQPHSLTCVDVENINKYCPGISCLVRSSFSYILDSIGMTPRKLKDSDFIDVIHSMYSPYVSLFRADAFMAPHIRGNLIGQKTLIADKLEDIPGQISELLDRSS